MLKLLFIVLTLALLPSAVLADGNDSGESFFGGEWYFEWGYNRNFWAPSDIHVSQPSLKNDFTVHKVHAQDYPQWNEQGFIFNKDFSIPQFDFRIGRFIDKAHEWAIELSVDHTKYSSLLDQEAHITGTINGQPVDTISTLTSSYFRYYLHNGANHIMLNLVRRYSLLGQLNRTFNLSILAKGGLGIMLPHSESTIFGNDSDVGPKSFGNMVGVNNGWWQLNGWTAGAEIAVRFVILRPIFIEFADKIAFASLYNVPVYMGRADQNLWMNEWMFNLGITINAKLGS